jgi:hypothetical protein
MVTIKNQNLLNFSSSGRNTALKEALPEWIKAHLQRLYYARIKKLINRVKMHSKYQFHHEYVQKSWVIILRAFIVSLTEIF